MPYDLAVAYRVYPGVSKTPALHTDDKFALAELCLRSFKAAVAGLSVKIWAILDNCPDEYQQLFQAHFAERDLVFLRLPGVGNQATFEAQIDVLLGQSDSEMVYFAEDDYFYLPHALGTLCRFLQERSRAMEFAAPYDHPGYYDMRLHRNTTLIHTGERHWRRVNSTTLTFLTTKATLQKTASVFRTYRHKRNLDTSIWLSLTKQHLFHPFFVLPLLRSEPAAFKMFAKAWIYNWRQILFGKTCQLWTPLPSLATHMDAFYLAPGVDWDGQWAGRGDFVDK